MSQETIALLTILRDETQSRDILARCDKEIDRLGKPITSRAVLDEWKRANDEDFWLRGEVRTVRIK